LPHCPADIVSLHAMVRLQFPHTGTVSCLKCHELKKKKIPMTVSEPNVSVMMLKGGTLNI
jgi:hypothetical protein